MSDLKKEYEMVLRERKCFAEQINALKEDEKVKRYFELCEKDNFLAEQQKHLYKEMKTNEYCSCNHLLVTVLHDYDSFEGRSCDYHGCVKCGLSEKVLYLMEWLNNPDNLESDERIMYDFLKNGDSLCGTNANIHCDLELAQDIYRKIMIDNPGIDDETAAKHLVAAIYSVRPTEESNKRNASRTKKLTRKGNN
jgi:hypothetical protein